ncbi:hypothetical protein Tco_0885375 [Tanacetum coccineum]
MASPLNFLRNNGIVLESDFAIVRNFSVKQLLFQKDVIPSFVAQIPTGMDLHSLIIRLPISLIGIVYKGYSRYFAQKKAPGSFRISSRYQFRLICLSGRQNFRWPFILDGNTPIGVKERNKKAMSLKVRLCQIITTTDSLGYLLEVLEALGFGRTGVIGFRDTLTSAKASILIMEGPSKFVIPCLRGLKQGDLVQLPYLFILIIGRSLHNLFHPVVRQACSRRYSRYYHCEVRLSLSRPLLCKTTLMTIIGEWSNENSEWYYNNFKELLSCFLTSINIP